MVQTKLSAPETVSYHHHSGMRGWLLYNPVHHFISFVLFVCQTCCQLVMTLAKVQK